MLKQMTRYLGQREAQRFDEQLMSSRHGFSIDQLMELAGLSVAEAVGKEFPSNVTSDGGWKRVLVVAGPGNNGSSFSGVVIHCAEGEVKVDECWLMGEIAAAFWLHTEHFVLEAQRKAVIPVTQCEQLKIPFIEDIPDASSVDAAYDLILDGIFGFNFSGSIRPPFDHIVGTLQKCETPIVSIDIPSGWHVENGELWLILLAHSLAYCCCSRMRSDVNRKRKWKRLGATDADIPDSAEGLRKVLYRDWQVSLCWRTICANVSTVICSIRASALFNSVLCRSLAEEFNLELPGYSGVEQCMKLPVPY
ncbi:hypothetical protein KXD40_001199 [Peronospora effusa]|uniref:NAD(P)H-hydrate epimerase n=1 Tax=Peronospora effusa TaxID=542832 RepID=A0A3R7XJJ6_9STRA|nr:hypothetical protein DD237_002352 [Peronospora effusa]UIZ21331.1 hypothetical protein KXD40_001199 [Peronospora effusa]